MFAREFYDDFSENFSNWTLENNGYSLTRNGSVIDGVYGWYIYDGKLMGEAGYEERSYLFPNFDDVTNFEFSCKSVSLNGVDQSFWFRLSEDKRNYYEIDYRFDESQWPQDNNNITIWKIVDGDLTNVLNTGNLSNINLSLSQNVEHDIKFSMQGDTIRIYFDSILITTYVDPSPLPAGGFGMKNWGGTFYPGPVLNSYDDIRIVDLNSQSDLENKKVIIVPGLGASWNTRALLGSTAPDLEWELPFFVKNYENLKNAFISNGYTEDQNLFLWTYDWRRPVAEIVEDFGEYLTTVTDGNDEIVVIGHSLGGLMARLWYQKNLGDTRVDKVISLGSPHMGSVDAYEAWNGGNVSRAGLHSIAFNILVLLNKGRTESIPEVIHRIAPVTRDLQPTFNFVYKNKSLVPFTGLTNFNSYLALENLSGETGLTGLHTFAGVGIDTKEFLTLGERTFFDERLDIWPDGHVIDTTYSLNGDNTVLSGSARMGNHFYELSTDHGNLPDESISQIMTILGLSTGSYSLIDYDFSAPQLIFYIASPAHLEINCGGINYVSDDMGFVVINKSEVSASCQVNVVADGDGGDYKLVVGDSQNSWWSSFSDSVGMAQSDTYRFDKNAMLLKDDNVFEIYRNYCLGLMDNYSGEKYLDDCLLACDNREAEALMDSVFGFRDKHRDFNISWEMLDKLIPLLEKDNISREVAEYMLKNGNDMFGLVDAVADLKEGLSVITDDFGVESYAMAQKIFSVAGDDFASGQYGLVDARFDLARRILRQIW